MGFETVEERVYDGSTWGDMEVWAAVDEEGSWIEFFEPMGAKAAPKFVFGFMREATDDIIAAIRKAAERCDEIAAARKDYSA